MRRKIFVFYAATLQDNLAEVGWTNLIVEVPDDDLPPLRTTAFCNILALR